MVDPTDDNNFFSSSTMVFDLGLSASIVCRLPSRKHLVLKKWIAYVLGGRLVSSRATHTRVKDI